MTEWSVTINGNQRKIEPWAPTGQSQLPRAIAPPRALGQCALLQCDAPASWFAGCFENLGTDYYGSQGSWPGPFE